MNLHQKTDIGEEIIQIKELYKTLKQKLHQK